MAKRPVNLNLFTIKFPITAIVSILHRASGAILFLLIPFLLWLFDTSLASEGNFIELQAILVNPLVKILIWLILAAFFYHLLAGIRHMVMDLGFAESLQAGRFSSWLVIILTLILIILTGIWLWVII